MLKVGQPMADIVDEGNDINQQRLDAALANRVKFEGESRTTCIDCGEPIHPKRRALLAGVQDCIECAEWKEALGGQYAKRH